MIDKIKRFLGLEKDSPYVKNYLNLSNARSNIYMSLIVIVLEIWMIISVLINILTSNKVRTLTWIIQHFSSYVILLLVATLILIHSIKVLKEYKINSLYGNILNFIFAIVAIIFGIYISYLDYKKGELVLTFITMEVFIVCLIAWRPIISILFTTVPFLFFYFLCDRAIPATYATQVNLFTTWIAITIAAISIYHQRHLEAQNSEQLESTSNTLLQVAVTDDLTGVSNMRYFRNKSLQVLKSKNTNIEELVFLFTDIQNFKNYNEKYGFEEANDFLKKFAGILKEEFPNDIIARVSDDHFALLTKISGFQDKFSKIRTIVQNIDVDISLDVKVGAFKPTDRECAPITACDRARYACNSIKKKYNKFYCEYESKMDQDFNRKRYIINNLDKAISNGYIKPFYQPVVWSKNGKLCGVEALARWDDPDYGLLPPGAFISVLEEYHKIHLLDMSIVESVCKDLRNSYDNHLPIIPVSLNFSRLDFELLGDVFAAVEACIKKYDINRNDLHIEITESALTNNDELLKKTMEDFRTHGYALWLDDFGSGYSGLNVLKEYDFDVMKIDMIFLSKFSEYKKSRPIIKSIVDLAGQINMKTLTEGVETPEQYDFLKEIGCERLQGYLFGKPMPRAELYEKIENGTYDTSELKIL